MNQLLIPRLIQWLSGCWLLLGIVLLTDYCYTPLFPGIPILKPLSILSWGGFPVYLLYTLWTRSRKKQSALEEKLRRLQMNPHFLFNMLNSIAEMSRQQGPAAVDRFLVRYARLMRLVLDHSNNELISLSEELEMIRMYLELECTRKNHTFTYDISLDADIDADTVFVPPLLLQPFVENSIWHGLQNIENGSIKIQIIYNPDHLEYLVTDNGSGINPAIAQAKHSGSGKGIKITRDRIRYRWQSWWPPADFLQLRNQHEGLQVAIRVPLIQ
jgi:sensor histidine kinase YesM